MAIAYVPPGVRVSELASPSINPLLAAPANVCLVGTAQGYIQRTDQVLLTNEDAVALPNFPQGVATLTDPVISVTNVNSLGAYTEDTDYVVNYATGVSEVQILTVDATSGTFTLTFGDETTAPIAEAATAGTVKTALETLTNVEVDDIAVTGSAGGPWTFTFAGQYALVDVPLITGDGSALVGGSTTVLSRTTVPGGVVATIRRDDAGTIADGETVNVVYRYLPQDYFLPTRLDEQSTVEDRFGSAFNPDGSINSEVSFAAGIALENGAREVIIQALFRRTTDGEPDSVKRQPTDSEVQGATTWEQTYYGLREIDDINIIVQVSGQSLTGFTDAEWLAISQKLQAHIKFMKDQQQYVIGIVGEDSSTSSSVAEKATLISHAQTISSSVLAVNEQLVFVAPSKFTRVNPQTSKDFYVGGQYVGAGIAGMLAGQAVSASITRKVVSGFTGVADPRSKADKNLDAQNGLLVVEQRGPVVQVRHGVTLDTSSTAKRELPVVRAKHRMIESIRDTIETQIIGQVIADGQAPAVVASTVASVLEQLKTEKDLVDYNNIQSRTLTLDPTTVEVRFSYKPAFPLNYVNVNFAIDLSTGEVVTI